MSEQQQPPTEQHRQGKDWHRLHLWQIQPVRDAALILLVFGLIYLGNVLSVITVPLLVAIGLAYLIEPVVSLLVRKAPWLGRRGAVLVMMGTLTIACFGILIGTVPVVIKQAGNLMTNSDRYLMQIRDFAKSQDLPTWLQERLQALSDLLPATASSDPSEQSPPSNDEETSPTVTPESESTPAPAAAPLDETRIRALIREEMANEQVASTSAPTLSKVASGSVQVIGFFVGLIGGVAQFGIFLFVSAFCFYFFSTSFPAVRDYIRSFIPASNRERSLDLIGRMDSAISGFVRGRITICLVMGVIYAVGWTLCGVPHAVLLGLLTGLLGLVPYLSAVGLPLAWVLLAVSLNSATERTGFYYAEAAVGATASLVWWKIIVMPAIVNVVAQTIEDYVLNPMIQGKATNLHPATILLACIAGGVLGGLYGMILAIPVTACIKIMMDEVILPRTKQWLDGRRDDPLPL